jgi:hypothetical protein
MKKINWQSNGYYIILLILFILLGALLYFFKIHQIFYDFYLVNYEQINTSFISLFGIMFGFLFTSMAILFSLNDNSLFIQLVKKNKRNKRDIISYFSLAIISSLLVVLISLFLTITFVDSQVDDSDLSTMIIEDICGQSVILTKIPIYVLVYLSVFTMIQFVLLMISFIGLLLDDKNT